MSSYNNFASRGSARGTLDKKNGIGMRTVNENRKPIYIVYILDKSGSMSGTSTVITETGEAVRMRKIDQLNDAVKRITGTLRSFEASNPLYRVCLQIIELDSYGKAVFPEFLSVSRGFEEIQFEADGCTELKASLSTLKTYISTRYLKDERAGREDKGYNKAVSVILMSDGRPTDCNGLEQSDQTIKGIVDEFKQYLRDMDYARNVDLYSIAVGDDADESMLRYFCDGDGDVGDRSRFYRVDECESIANALDFVTRATLAHHTTMQIPADFADFGDDEDDEDIDAGSSASEPTVVVDDEDDDNGVVPDTDEGNNVSDTSDDDEDAGIPETDDMLDDIFDGLD